MKLVESVLLGMDTLTQLKLAGIDLNHKELIDKLQEGIEKWWYRDLESIDFEDSKLSTENLSILTTALKQCNLLLSLKISENICETTNEYFQTLINNIKHIIEECSSFNHLDVSGMALKFDACN